MCDCYTAKCEGCGCEMEIHIADFCTARENVHPYCTRCTKKWRKRKEIPSGLVFVDKVSRQEPNCVQVKGAKIGENVVILCDDLRAYGVHLN